MAVLSTQQARRARLRGGAARPARPTAEQLRLDTPPAGRSRAGAPSRATPPMVRTDLADPAPQARGSEQRPHDGPTLDELLVGVWEGLAVGEEVACPVCRSGALAPEAVDGRRAAVIVSCPTCASRLAR